MKYIRCLAGVRPELGPEKVAISLYRRAISESQAEESNIGRGKITQVSS